MWHWCRHLISLSLISSTIIWNSLCWWNYIISRSFFVLNFWGSKHFFPSLTVFLKWSYPPSSKLSFPRRLVVMMAFATTGMLSTGDKQMFLFHEFFYLCTWIQCLNLMSVHLSSLWKCTHRQVQCTDLPIKHLLHVCVILWESQRWIIS